MRVTGPLARTILQPLGIAVALALLLRGAVHLYAIPSGSMEPTLRAGDRILVTRYLRHEPHRGQVIVFSSPLNDREVMVKRIVAEPGDLIDSRGGRLRIAGHTVAEPFSLSATETGSIPPQIVPAGCYFVMGDNRRDSLDSRSWGVVPRTQIIGRARLVLWSSDGELDRTANAAVATARDTIASSSGSRRVRLFKWIE